MIELLVILPSIIASRFQASKRNTDARSTLMLHVQAFASNADFRQQRDWMARSIQNVIRLHVTQVIDAVLLHFTLASILLDALFRQLCKSKQSVMPQTENKTSMSLVLESLPWFGSGGPEAVQLCGDWTALSAAGHVACPQK